MGKKQRTSEAAKATRSRSRARGQERKQARRTEGERLHLARAARYSAGVQMPRDLMWDNCKEKMKMRRAAKRQMRQEGAKAAIKTSRGATASRQRRDRGTASD